MDRDSCARLGILSPEEIAKAFAATAVPEVPDARRCADELRPITAAKPSPAVENAAIAVGVVSVLAGLFLT